MSSNVAADPSVAWSVHLAFLLMLGLFVIAMVSLSHLTEQAVTAPESEADMLADSLVLWAGQKRGLTSSRVVLKTSPLPSPNQVLTITAVDGTSAQAEWLDPVARSNDGSNTVVVKHGVVLAPFEYNTIAEALAFLATQDVTELNPWVVLVYPGTYFESNLVVPSFVTVQGLNHTANIVDGDPLTSTQVHVASSNTHTFILSDKSSLHSLAVRGPNSEGYAAVYCNAAPNQTHIENCIFYDISVGVLLENGDHVNVLLEDCQFQNCTMYAVHLHGNEMGTNLVCQSLSNVFYATSALTSTLSMYRVQGSHTTLVSTGEVAQRDEGLPMGMFLEIVQGAKVRMMNAKASYFATAVSIPVSVATPQFIGANLLLTSCTQSVAIPNLTCVGNITGVMNPLTVSILSPYLSVNYTDPSGLGVTMSGQIYQGTTAMTTTNITDQLQRVAALGLLTGGQLSMGGTSTLTATAGTGYVSRVDGSLLYVTWSTQTLDLSGHPSQQINIWIDAAGVLHSGVSLPNLYSNVVLGIVNTTPASTEFYIQDVPRSIPNLASSLNNMLEDALGPIFPVGGCTTTNTLYQIAITSGSYYYGNLQFTYPGKALAGTFHPAYFNATNWVFQAATDQVPVTWNNGAGALVPISSPTNYIKHAVYVMGGSAPQTFLVYGQEEFANLSSAQTGPLPSVASLFAANVVSVAALIVGPGPGGPINSIQNICPSLGFRSSGVSATANHSLLLNLAADDHLQYLPTNGSRPMTGTLPMANNPIAAAGSLALVNPSTPANMVTVQASTSLASSWQFTLPTTAGVAGQTLQTDGAGVTSWQTPLNGSIQFKQMTIDQTTSSTTLVPLTQLSGFVLDASSSYYLRASCMSLCDSKSHGYLISTGTSGPVTNIDYLYTYTDSSSETLNARVTTVGDLSVVTSTSHTPRQRILLEGYLSTSAAITFSLTFLAKAGGTCTVYAGSFVYVQKIA